MKPTSSTWFRTGLRHLLVQDAPPGRHPLHVPRPDVSGIAQRVLVTHLPMQDVRDGLNASMRMQRNPGRVIRRIGRGEIVEQSNSRKGSR